MSGLGPSLFDSVPEDYLHQFSRGSSFNAKAVPQMLGLKVSVLQSLFRQCAMTLTCLSRCREHLEEIGNTMNMVAQAFGGDVESGCLV